MSSSCRTLSSNWLHVSKLCANHTLFRYLNRILRCILWRSDQCNHLACVLRKRRGDSICSSKPSESAATTPTSRSTHKVTPVIVKNSICSPRTVWLCYFTCQPRSNKPEDNGTSKASVRLFREIISIVCDFKRLMIITGTWYHGTSAFLSWSVQSSVKILPHPQALQPLSSHWIRKAIAMSIKMISRH